MSAKLTKEDFLRDAIAHHGSKYDYSLVEYINNSTKVKIICPVHGEFTQRPQEHKKGFGCKYCGGECGGRVRRGNAESWIAKAKKKHGDKYDYSQSNYQLSNIKVNIRCLEHGVFTMRPSNHLNGQGCPDCGARDGPLRSRQNNNKIKNWVDAQDEWVGIANEVHAGKYDYSKFDYTKGKTKVCIICPEHGEFYQYPIHHITGSGCPTCAGCARLDTNKFIDRAVEIHGNRYGYSKVEYERSHKHVLIICPDHGEFKQLPYMHLQGQRCKWCAGQGVPTTEQWVEKAIAIHGDKYDYSRAVYTNSSSKVEIICPEHGVFTQGSINHTYGQGCPKCRSDTNDEWIVKAKAVHGDKYDYSITEFKNTKKKVSIICPEHGEFVQMPLDHLRNGGCASCAVHGFDPFQPAILYYLRVETRNQTTYKVGITNRTVKERFTVYDLERVTIIREKFYTAGIDARDEETRILRQFKEFMYIGEPLLSSGNSELFDRDVLLLDGA
jgi:hypothetical protein